MQKERGRIMSAKNDLHTMALLSATTSGTGRIPNQAVPNSQKGDKFYRETLEAFEGIGLKQINKNLEFNDIYAMLDGELIVTNFLENSRLISHIGSLYTKEDFNMPDYVKPFDLLNRVVRYQSTKYTELAHRFNVDFIDPISQNEIDREFNNQLMQFAIDNFNIEREYLDAINGLNLDGQEFESEEEQQAYLEDIERRRRLISSPEEIKDSIQRNWKPIAVDWVHKTLERDSRRFNHKRLYQKYYTDFYSTGRYFNHLNIHKMGVYTQERWSPIYTFFSEEYDLEFPQYASYIGYIDTIGKDQLVTEHGQSISDSDLRKIINFDGKSVKTGNSLTDKNTYSDILRGSVVDGMPRDYFQREAYYQLEQELGLPLSNEYYFNMDGELESRNAYTMTYSKHQKSGPRGIMRKLTRRDIDVEDDIYLRTRVYWTSYERVGYLYYDDDGATRSAFITEDILPEVLEKHNAKVKRTLTIKQLDELERKGNVEPGTLCYTRIPVTYYGVLIRTKGLGLNKDLILDAGKMELQIKGDDDNIYNVLKPVTGIITMPEINKLIPHQIEYTYNLNLSRKYSENELGMLFLMDVNFLGSEYSSAKDAGSKFTEFLNHVKGGMVIPVDASRRNLRENQGQEMNPMGIYEVTNTRIINDKIQLAEYHKAMLLEEAGLSQQLLNEPQKYVTAEGIKSSGNSTQTILDYNFDRMDEARLKDMEVAIRVAQFQESGKRGINFAHTRDDGELDLMAFTDDFLALRKFNLISLEDSEKRRRREEIKNYILSTNTFEDETETLVKLATSDSFTTMMQQLKEMEIKRQERMERAEQAQAQESQERNEAIVRAEEIISERDVERNKVEIKKAIISAVASMSKSNQPIQDPNKVLMDLYNEEVRSNDKIDQLDLEYSKVENQNIKIESDAEYRMKRLELDERRIKNEEERLRIRDKEDNSNNFKKIIENR